MKDKTATQQSNIVIKLPTTSELYKKYFPTVYGGSGVGLLHPNMEAFFSELNDVCIIEDSIKKLNLHPIKTTI